MRTFVLPVLSAALFLVAQPAHVFAETASTPLVSPDQRSAHFAAVNKHLELGGVFYGYVDIDGDIEKFGEGLNELTNRFATIQPQLAMVKQDYGTLLGTLGLTDVKAVGLSSVAIGKGFRNRTFIYTPNGRHGLLRMLGGAPYAFTGARTAPADADFFCETDIDVPVAYSALKEVVAKVGGAALVNTMEAELQKKTEQGLVPYDVIQHLAGRITFFGRLNPQERLTFPGKKSFEVPGILFFFRVEGAGKTFEPALASLPMFRKGTDGGLTLYEMPEPVGGKSLQPVFAMDGTALIFANSRTFLNECLSRTVGLDQQAEFKEALAAVGTEGNGVSYVTPRFFDELRKAITAIEEENPESKIVIESWVSRLPKIDRPLVSVRTNQPDGILIQSLWNTSLKQDAAMVLMANPVTIGVLAAMAIPAFQKVRVSSQEKTIQNNLRQYKAAGEQFMLESGKTTATYKDVVGPDKYIKSLKPVAGEDYTKLVLHGDDEQLSIRTKDGKIVTLSQ